MTNMTTPQHNNWYHCPGNHEIYKFGNPSLVIIIIYIVCLIHVRQQQRRQLLKNNAFLQNDSMTTPQHNNHCPRNHEIHNFGRPFIVHHNYIFSLADLCLGAEKNIHKVIHKLNTFTSELSLLEVWVIRFFLFLSPCLKNQICERFFQYIVLEKKLTDDRQRTTHVNGRQSKAIGQSN